MNPPNNPEAGEQPSPVTQAGEQPRSDDHMDQLGDHSSEALMAALEESESEPDSDESDGSPPTPAPTGTAPDPKPSEDAPEPEAGEQPPAEPKADSDNAPKTPDRVRINSLNPDDQKLMVEAVAMVRDGQAKSIPDAIAQLGAVTKGADADSGEDGDGGDDHADDQPESRQPEAEPASRRVETLKAKIADLRDQRRQAITDYDTEAQSSLTDQIEDLLAEVHRAEEASGQELKQQRDYNTRIDQEFDAVEERYPGLKDESTAHYRMLSDRIEAAKARKDPALKDPAYIGRFADEIAADLGISKGKTTTPPPARPARQPVGADLAPAHGSADRHSEDQLREMIRTGVSSEALEEALFTE